MTYNFCFFSAIPHPITQNNNAVMIKLIQVIGLILISVNLYGQESKTLETRTVADYLNKHKKLEKRYFNMYSNSRNLEKYQQKYGLNKEQVVQHKPKLLLSRTGKKGEHLGVLFEVAILEGGSSFELGIYKNDFADNTISYLTSLLNTYLFKKTKLALSKIQIMGTIEGIADSVDIGGTRYGGEYGMIHRSYQDLSSGGSAPRTCNLNSNDRITNLQLAFLRAYNALQIFNQDLKPYSIIEQKDITIHAIDERFHEGYQWRKVTLKLEIKNFYLDDFELLEDDLQDTVITILE